MSSGEKDEKHPFPVREKLPPFRLRPLPKTTTGSSLRYPGNRMPLDR